LIERSAHGEIKFSTMGATFLSHLGDRLLCYVFEQEEETRPAFIDEVKRANKVRDNTEQLVILLRL